MMDAHGWWQMIKNEPMSPLVGHVVTSLVLYAEALEQQEPPERVADSEEE
jgi:hypothetical protein